MREKIDLLTAYLKKYWIFIFLAIIATAMVLIKFLYSQPSNPQKPGNVNIEAPKIEIIGTEISGNLTLDFKNFPDVKKLPYYSGNRTYLSESQAKEIANIFGFKLEANITEDINKQKNYIWTDRTRYLIIDPATSEINLAYDLMNNPNTLPTSGSLPSKDETITILHGIYQQLNLNPRFETLSFHSLKYYEINGPVLKESVPERASLIEVGFVQKIDKYPILESDPEKSPLRIMLDKNKNLIQFENKIAYQSFSAGPEYKLKDQNEVKNKLNEEGKITWVENYSQGISEANISSGKIDEIQIIFLQPSNDFEKILPVYLLKGQAVIYGREDKLDIYLPSYSSN